MGELKYSLAWGLWLLLQFLQWNLGLAILHLQLHMLRNLGAISKATFLLIQTKVYHLPGMEDYQSTIIDPAKGERWFCTESEAIESGWHKAPR
ncbi:hypothetical protein MC7420_8149 [Coleofasciculus chthonoplastes PCC 7420]|uniref:Uncharacterized protein n=1 Tax=Coleofasciculus chthonoplastes PCC 7420 TaxID=118168 RepID=B4W535_9CYAN|nr:hypothetical protein MC7420_8149 [Coleofasciculus chthonoplastes PCC 7420]